MPPAKKALRRDRSPRSGARRADVYREMNGKLVLSALRAHEAVDAVEERELLLRETAELRERLLGILGHDLRTPLSAMMIGAEVLADSGRLHPEDAMIVERLLRSARRMNRMIGQILDFTRSRLGGGMLLELHPASNLGDVCRAVADELVLSRPGSVEWSTTGDVTGSWDVDRLTQAISNIARNGVEHARAGTAVILYAHAEGDEVVVEIRNEGTPIAPELLPVIFDPFRRAKERHPSKTGNLGLGLYIAQEITRAHGGSLGVTSATGATVFTLRLPRLPRPAASRAPLPAGP